MSVGYFADLFDLSSARDRDLITQTWAGCAQRASRPVGTVAA